MAGNLIKIVGGCMVEVIREDACGLPLVGVGHTNNTIRTKGLIQVDLTPDVDNGTEITERNMCGDICINEKDCPVIKGFNGKMKLCAVDPALLELLLGVTPILNTESTPEIIGGKMKGESRAQCNKFHMKIWGKPAQGCSNDLPWVVFSFPLCENAVLSSSITFANKQHQAWEIDFYAREGNADFVDPTLLFTSAECSNDLWAWKSTATLPTETTPGSYTSI